MLSPAALLALINTCEAAPLTMQIEPDNARIGLTVFAVGLFPVPGEFHRFSGNLRVDPASPGSCDVSLDVTVASLQMDDPGRTPVALGPRLLDAAHFPTLHYSGTCSAGVATGLLTMHGVTHPLSFTASRDGDAVDARGSLRRGDFGVSGLPGLVGRRVDMRFSVTLPPGLAAQLQPARPPAPTGGAAAGSTVQAQSAPAAVN